MAESGRKRPKAGARIQKRKRRMVAFSPPRNRKLRTRHLHVANTGPVVGVPVDVVWDAFAAYGLLERIVVEHVKRAYAIVSFMDIAAAVKAQQARDRPPGAGSRVKDSFMPEPGKPVPLRGRWLRVTFAEQRRPLDEQDARTGIVYDGPAGHADRVAQWRREHAAHASVASMSLEHLLAHAGGDKAARMVGVDDSVDAFSVMKRARTQCDTDATGGKVDEGGPETAAQAGSTAATDGGMPRRIQCPLCLNLFARGRGLRMHLIADATGRGHGLAGEVLAATVAAADALAARAAPAAKAAASKCKAASQRPPVSTQVKLDAGLAAARDGDVVKLRAFIAGGQWDVLTVDKNGGYALHWAAGAGHLDACKVLVEEAACDARVAVTKGRRDGRTALHWAARNGHVHVCTWLVQAAGVPVDVGTRDGTTAIMWAVWQGHIDVADALLSLGAALDSVNDFGCTAAHWLALGADDNLAMAHWLLRHRACVDFAARNTQAHSCLHKAAWKGHRRLCRWLLIGDSHLPTDAKPSTAPAGLLPLSEAARRDEGGYDAADIAAMAGHHDLAAWLRGLAASASQQATACLPDKA